jgi:organic radical activating enzyme
VLPIIEDFETVQGEGYWTGTPSYFIRLAGCDVGCVWCDTKYSWDMSKGQEVAIEELLQRVKRCLIHHVVVTGGEPFMHELTEFTQRFHEAGFFLQVETSGTYPLSGQWDWITFSPKKFRKPLPIYFDQAHELKVVIYHPKDLEWAEVLRNQMARKESCFLQLEWSKQDRLLPVILEYLKTHPHWRLSLQIHKWLNIP